MTNEDLEVLTTLAQSIFDKKGFNILVLDARHFPSLADYFIIAEGRSDRHVRALCDAVVVGLKDKGRQPLNIEGKRHGDWVAIDYGYMIVHLFGPNKREWYSLEELWRECQIVDVPLVIRPEVTDQDFQE